MCHVKKNPHKFKGIISEKSDYNICQLQIQYNEKIDHLYTLRSDKRKNEPQHFNNF